MTVVTAAEKTPAPPDAPQGARRTVRPLVFNLMALVLGVTRWASAAATGLVDIPGPLSVGSRAGDLLADGTLGQDALASLRRGLLGFALGPLAAVPMGLLMGWYPIARGVLEPYVNAVGKVEPGNKVVKVLQEANDWRAAHPEESTALAAKMLKADEATVAADAGHVKTMTTADLAAKTEDGSVGKWLDGMSRFFTRTGQLAKTPDPSTFYDGDLYTKAAAK